MRRRVGHSREHSTIKIWSRDFEMRYNPLRVLHELATGFLVLCRRRILRQQHVKTGGVMMPGQERQHGIGRIEEHGGARRKRLQPFQQREDIAAGHHAVDARPCFYLWRADTTHRCDDQRGKRHEDRHKADRSPQRFAFFIRQQLS